MDWMVYWFMLPVCVVVASVAMFSGISGAALLMPVFLIGFPLLGAPALGAVAAVGMSLFLETSGFGTGVYRYLRRGLVDRRAALRLAAVSVPAAVAGSLLASTVPVSVIRVGYGVGMVALGVFLLAGQRGTGEVIPQLWNREILTTDGASYRYRVERMNSQAGLTGAGAFVAGLISTGVGEATLPGLVRRSGFPIPVAAATSTVVVAATVTGAAITHLFALSREGGWAAIPWNLLVWAVPGAVVGALIGTKWQGRISEQASHRFFGVLFLAIGVTFLAAFTVFSERFA